MTTNNIFFELQNLIKNQNLPPFPSFLPAEHLTQEILEKYKALYKIYLNELTKTDINLYYPFIFDFLHIPIYCKDLSEIENLLKDEPTLNDCFNTNFTMPEQKPETEFKTAKGTTPKPDAEQEQEIDKECNIEKRLLERIKNEILNESMNTSFEDIAGLELVKRSLQEMVVWPMLRPDLFQGLRSPPRGLLLFGPPGTGKTMIGRCVASQIKATFFNISASSLTSKWVGEGEKMVKGLFYLARKMQPSVIFVDEIDSLLSQRSENENEGSRRIKTEFLVQFDGAATNKEDRLLLIGATNRPQEIDEAARRRLVKRIYVPLPEKKARIEIIARALKDVANVLNENDLNEIGEITEGYSGSDVYNLCREAAMEPLREIRDIERTQEAARMIVKEDFIKAVKQIRKSVSVKDLSLYEEWNQNFGSVA